MPIHWIKVDMYDAKSSKVEDAKTNIPIETNTLNILQNKLTLIMRLFTTLTPTSCVGFGSFTNETLNSYNFCIRNSNWTYFGVLESPCRLLMILVETHITDNRDYPQILKR